MWKIASRLAFALLMGAAAPWAGAEEVAPLLADARRGGDYQVPAAADVERADELFLRCFDQCEGAEMSGAWRRLGFELVQARLGAHGVAVVREEGGRREGRGAFLFRTGSKSEVALQAPHSFKDEHTGDIALLLMEAGDFRAAAWNTVPRRYERGGVTVDADMAHLNGTYFQAFSRAFARRFAQGRLIQLHGFAQDKRRSGAGLNADMVVSSGTQTASISAARLAGCLKGAGWQGALLYPDQIRELGATTNSSGRLLQAMGHGGFLHVEMSAPVREDLLRQPRARAALLECLQR